MALPTIEKTWEERRNVPVFGDVNSQESHFRLYVALKNVMTDTLEGSHVFSEGQIDEVSAGATYAVSPANIAGREDMFDPARIGNVVGKKIRIRGEGNAGNNGDFTISGQVDVGGGTYRLEYPNASGVAVSLNGGTCSSKVIRGTFTNPWVLSHSGQRSGVWTTQGAQDDGIDALRNSSDVSVVTNGWPFFVLRHPVTLDELYFSLHSTTGSFYGTYGNHRYALRNFRFGSRTAVNATPPMTFQGNPYTDLSLIRPTGQGVSGFFESSPQNSSWFNAQGSAQASWNALVNCDISSDGKHTRVWVASLGFIPLFWSFEEVKDPTPEWATARPNPRVICQRNSNSQVANGATVDLNDARFYGGDDLVRDDLGDNSTFWLPSFYSTAEGMVAATVAENIAVANEISGRNPLFRMGLATDQNSVEGRHGQLKDLWFNQTGLDAGVTFPDDTSRQFLCIGDITVPNTGGTAPILTI